LVLYADYIHADFICVKEGYAIRTMNAISRSLWTQS
jgi:hypothetical protein